jgi:sugar lactone lactonase YvrE
MKKFRLAFSDIDYVGRDLRRPECVLTTATGDLYVSDERGGVTHIKPDGTCHLFKGLTPTGNLLSANGFAMLKDGSFLIAPLCGGGVYRLDRRQNISVFLDAVDGHPLACPNFVLLDDKNRIWICCLTRQARNTLNTYTRDQRDGYIVLVDHKGARVVADNIGYPNEIRIDPTGKYLYTNETLAARLLRFPLGEDGTLGAAQVVAAFDESYLFDGFTLDSEGGAWMTALVSNRLLYVPRDGEPRILLEDGNPDQLMRLTHLQKTTGVTKELLYEDHGARLRNPSSIAFGGSDLKTAFMGSLMGSQVIKFQVPVAGMRPAHWNFGPF